MKILFYTYDGLTDPLGQSQILPYMCNLAQKGYNIHIFSFEKIERFNNNFLIVKDICDEHNIKWHYLSFSNRIPLLSKLYDLRQMYLFVERLHRKEKFDLFHCRSYQSAYVARLLKKTIRTPFLFDMRGFWIDERVEGGIWNNKNPLFKFIYKLLKNIEGKIINNSDAIVSLTESGKLEIESWSSYNPDCKIWVIPTSVDFEAFKLTNSNLSKEARKQLNIDSEDFVISYLGSIGTWYLLNEMLDFYSQMKSVLKQNTKFLFLTPDDPKIILNAGLKKGLTSGDFVIKSASRKEVNTLFKSSDISIFFIKQVYSKIASSPTKLGEILAMGIPVICNNQVGDVEQIINNSKGGYCINSFTEIAYSEAINAIPSLLDIEPESIRQSVNRYYNLDYAINTYSKIYDTICMEKNT